MGGVAYCYKCKMHFIDSVFRGNYAYQGGMFYIDRYGELILENVTIDSTRAHVEGGIVYALGTASDLNPKTQSAYVPPTVTAGKTYVNYVKVTFKTDANIPYKNLHSLKDGAGVYIKNGVLEFNNM